MIGLVVVTHGNLATEMISALEHVVGPQPEVASRKNVLQIGCIGGWGGDNAGGNAHEQQCAGMILAVVLSRGWGPGHGSGRRRL